MSTPAAFPASGASTAPTTPTDKNPMITELRNFLGNAPMTMPTDHDPAVRKFKMSNGEEISCVLYNRRFFITGTDVVKILIFRFQQLGRGILNPKKFEEGVFSDLRNLKPGTEAVLEEPRSEFLEFLHKHGCIRTQKKQKVFFWNKVPHDDLFREALERNLKRVTNVVSWAQLMNSPDVMKQYMMMQAAANGQMMMGMPMMPNQMMPPQYMQYPMVHPNMVPPAEIPVERTHPRRTISLSAVDFTSKNPHSMLNVGTAGGMGNMGGMGDMGNLGMPDISSALSSPLFSPDMEVDENYFDVPDTPTESKLSAEPITATSLTVAPSDLMRNDSSLPSTEEKLDVEMLNELEALGTPPELILDPTLGADLTSSDLLNDLWPGEKSSTMNAPLWDDLSMLMPNIEPNLRGSE
ncbi:hypothetical protein PSACC_00396 [Paramicrosporidium saccamoebae]|uniref:Uncharacterized protein n=1 Tax=Paramicrosporidium saccamoebae TaxID=1246581 RepID=A0A2H9TPR6_9FUNG|nr:hypothetical protein PSACC_00396 [Paramicrosporidium saccamoebae]